MKIEVKAYAKINLLLDIVATRKDGYHDLFMIMQSVNVYDTVTVENTDDEKITITCDDDTIPCNEKNIAYKAAAEFFNSQDIKNTGIHIDIKKRIPHAAGLAGGSADGAGVIVALNKIFKSELCNKQLCKIGVKVGADVPFCITGGTLLAQGIGDVLNPVKPLKKCHIVLAKPEIGVNTGYAYKQFDMQGKVHTPDKLGMLYAIQSGNLSEICLKMENVFEQFIEVPNRVDMKEIMRSNGALGTCMSGSGPTIFGIFTDKNSAKKAAEEIKAYAKDICICTPVSKGCKITKITE